MPTVPLGENPYLYQGGPTVPLRQQRTGGYAANTFGNRVFYTPEGSLPSNTLAPGLAPTPGAIARQNLTGAGLAGASIGGALAAQSVYSQGGGFFQAVGAGLGTTAGAFGGQVAGAAAGASVGGAAGSAIPGVGNVAGAGAGTVVGAVGGGLAGGAVGGSVGGGIGKSIDNFFWPDPAQPAIGILPQPGQAGQIKGFGAYPNQFPVGAAGAGPATIPGETIYGDPPFTGGQMPGVAYTLTINGSVTRQACPPLFTFGQTINQQIIDGIIGPITSVSIGASPGGPAGDCGPTDARITINHNGTQTFRTAPPGDTSATVISGVLSVSIARSDGLPDTGGNILGPVEGETEPDRAPNPYRPFGTDGAGRSLPDPPAPTQDPDRPWPERTTTPVPDTSPLSPTSPFTAPDPAPNFTPTPFNPTEPAIAPTRPSNPLNPGPSGPLPFADPDERIPFLPIPIFPGGINPPDVKNPQVPVTVPNGFRQNANTPTGSPQQLINPTTAPTVNPNVQPAPTPVPQPTRIEEGNCCIPPTDQELLRRLEAIKKAIGVDGLPASVPDQIAKQNPGQIQIQSLAELQLWQVQQLDGVMGRWPQQIPIPTPTGSVNVGMPNMAEAMSELVGMMVSQQVTATQILNTTSRTLAQAGSATQQAHLAHLTSKANAEFLGFESRPSEVDMPLAYTPGQSPFDGLLNESMAKIQGFENTDKQDLKSILAELLQAAAIIRAVYWRRLDTKGDLKTQLRKNLRGQGEFLDEVGQNKGADSDWEAYLNQVEEGFSGSTGDKTPYNRNPEERPKIKDRSPKTDKPGTGGK